MSAIEVAEADLLRKGMRREELEEKGLERLERLERLEKKEKKEKKIKRGEVSS